MVTKRLTKEQNRKIYCVKHGHAKYITNCFGYVYCGRCGQQIGDQLAGCFDSSNYLLISCPCKICNKIRRTLSKYDLRIVKELEAKNGN